MTGDKKVGVGVGVILVNDGKVLLGKRHDDPEKADSALNGEGTWTIPGGKLDFGESLEAGVVREVKEETNIDVNEEDLEFVSLSNDMVETAHFVTVGFLCAKWKGEPEVMEPDEITEWGWFDIENLPEPMFFPSAREIKNYREGVLYRKN